MATAPLPSDNLGSHPDAAPVSAETSRRSIAPIVATLLVLLTYSLFRAPIPAVNEPHYLGKAKHFWNPAWCPGDFFLDSSNPHAAFYALIGWLTRLVSLEQTAMIGRIAGFLLLASGWQRLGREFFHSPWGPPAAAATYATIAAWGNFAGEWLIGGIESKVFAYGCWLWAAAAARKGRLIAAGLWAGATVSLHPVVGVWCLIAAALAGILQRVTGGRAGRERGLAPAAMIQGTAAVGEPRGFSLRKGCIAAGALAVAAAPGLWPSLQIVVGVPPELAREADRIMLTQRLGHHLDPLLFPGSAYRQYGVLLIAWAAMALILRGRSRTASLQRFTLGALLIAMIGLIAGWLPEFTSLDRLNPWRILILKFYPFRLADLCIPIVISTLLVRLVEDWSSREVGPLEPHASSGRSASSGPLWAVLAVGLGIACRLPAPDANASGMSPSDRADWIRVCGWLRDNTNADALLATANESWAVKWFAERPEYVSFKDCPQDAAGIVEWWQRRQRLVAWSRAAKRDGVLSPADLQQLHAITGIDFMIVNGAKYGGFEQEPAYRQGPFEVYALPH